MNEWAARLGPALCGLGSAALLWWMVRPLNEAAARWSALVAASSLGLLVFSHGATFDIVLTFCLTLALCAWWRAQIELDAKRARRFLALFWVGVGLAFLAKGLIAFVLPALTLVIYAGLRARTGGPKIQIGLWWGLPLALGVGAIWYGPVIWANGWEFVNIFFVQHHFARFTSDKFKHHQPLWFYGKFCRSCCCPGRRFCWERSGRRALTCKQPRRERVCWFTRGRGCLRRSRSFRCRVPSCQATFCPRCLARAWSSDCSCKSGHKAFGVNGWWPD